MTPHDKAQAGELKRASQWIVSGDTGVSSKTIWACMMGVSQKDIEYCSTPSDPSDFGRCYRLFKLLPEWELRIDELRKLKLEHHINVGLSDEQNNDDLWGTFVDNYEKMKQLYEKEYETGSCPKLYSLMKSLCL